MKKLFNLLLLVIFLVFDCDRNSYALNFSDANEKSSWEVLADYGIINKQNSVSGYRLNDNALRQEAVIMALRLSGTSLPDSYSCKGYFKDVTNSKPNGWACKVAEMASNQGIINKTSSKFRPEDKITRAEALAIMMRAVKIDSSTTSSASSFSDVTIDWQVKLTNKALELGIIDGENLFYPNQDATRGEIFEITKRILLNYSKITNTYQSVTDISSLQSGVVNLRCGEISGTAFLMKIEDKYLLFTNRHVFEGSKNCIFFIENKTRGLAPYTFYTISSQKGLAYNNFTDFGAFKLTEDNKEKIMKHYDEGNLENLNYKISNLNICSNDLKTGSKVYTIGYPAYGLEETYVDPLNTSAISYEQIVSEGIISGHKNETIYTTGYNTKKKYPYDNYYVSNKLDSGNSGGPAFSIENGNLCLLGVVTWLSTGNYETQGIVQNINNITYTGDY